jgi:hypothetical protein
MFILLVYSLVLKISLMIVFISSVQSVERRLEECPTKLPGMAGARASTPGISAPRNAGTRMICSILRIGPLRPRINGKRIMVFHLVGKEVASFLVGGRQ